MVRPDRLYEAPFSRKSNGCSAGNYVDIVGVGSSILPAPTIFPRLAALNAKCSPGSQNLRGRFWAKVAKGEPADCWPWTATKTGNGYGNFKAPWGHTPAHRIAYWLSRDEYPDGVLVRHKCDNPICCNPDHLETGTHVDNARDMVERGRARNGHTGPLALSMLERE